MGELTWDGFAWALEVGIDDWSGYRNPWRRQRAERLRDPEPQRPDHVIDVVFAPEGRDDAPLTSAELELVNWFVDHKSELSVVALEAVFAEFPTIYDDFADVLPDEERAERLPRIETVSDLRDFMGLEEIFVHQVVAAGVPYVGFALGCSWDDEHGLGILLHGTRVVEVGDVQTASTLWIAEHDAEQVQEGDQPTE